MIAIDYRRGSHELVAPLEARGLPVVETDLPSADLSFTGKGEKGAKVDIGIEFKRLEELTEALRTGRLQGHQLTKMQRAFEFKWLLIEGEIVFDKRGRLLRRTGRREFRAIPGAMGVNELFKRVLVLHLRGGLNPVWSPNRRITLEFIDALYRIWTDKALDEHTSHLGIYQPPALIPISEFRQTVSSALFPGISIRKSAAVEQHFGGSLRRAVNAGAVEWSDIKVKDRHGNLKRLGMATAEKIQEKIK